MTFQKGRLTLVSERLLRGRFLILPEVLAPTFSPSVSLAGTRQGLICIDEEGCITLWLIDALMGCAAGHSCEPSP